jgi:hypothetical protein
MKDHDLRTDVSRQTAEEMAEGLQDADFQKPVTEARLPDADRGVIVRRILPPGPTP